MTALFHETSITPRDYQTKDVEQSFRLWDAGTVGTLTRAATGLGKTIMTALKFRLWLERGGDYRCMVISYEKQLVWQFAQEIEDVLGIAPGIEMESESVSISRIPKITVASRQTLQLHKSASVEQRRMLIESGLSEDVIGQCTSNLAKKIIEKAIDRDEAEEWLTDFNEHWMVNERGVSRLWKFDNHRYHWLVAFDEAHKHAYRLKTVSHLVDWFDANPMNRRTGMTATPKRSDGVSLKHKMFPGVALDYSLVNAVRDGYAVPYVQRFISVESLDFADPSLKRGKQNYDEHELEKLLRTEEQLAKMVEPLLDMVDERQTLIFSPGVQMARDVAAYINARCKCKCESCGKVRWYPRIVIDGGERTCRACGEDGLEVVMQRGTHAKSLDGSIPPNARRETYREHQSGEFQFLSVCNLCRESYNDPDISCVAIFRPVSEAASSLAEQMKGRGARPERGVIDGLSTREERLKAIAESAKPNCLIVDLVGVTGLADCATTLQIYAEGLPDEIKQIAADLIASEPDAEHDIQETIEKAKSIDKEQKEEAKRRREEEQRQREEQARIRAAAQAEVDYSVHETGTGYRGVNDASDKQLNYLRFLGFEVVGWMPSKRQAARMIGQITDDGLSMDEVAYQNGVAAEHWQPAKPSVKQRRYMHNLGIRGASSMTPKEASEAIELRKEIGGWPVNQAEFMLAKASLDKASSHEALTAVAKRLTASHKSGDIGQYDFHLLCKYGKERRNQINAAGEF